MRQKGALGVTTAERAVYGMLRIAALSWQLHSAGLSGPSLSRLTSLLKPGAPSETTPSRRPDGHRDPRAPPGSAPPFTRDPAPDSLGLSPPPSNTHTHQRALLSLRVTLLTQECKKEQYRPKVKRLYNRFHGFSMFVNSFDAT